MAVMHESFIGRILVRNLTWCFIALPKLGCRRSFIRAILVRGTDGPMHPAVRSGDEVPRATLTRGRSADPQARATSRWVSRKHLVKMKARPPQLLRSGSANRRPIGRIGRHALKPSCAPHQNRPTPVAEPPSGTAPTAPCPRAGPPPPCASAPRCSARQRRPAPHACA